MTKKEWQRQEELARTLMNMGFSENQIRKLRRASNGLHRWFEQCCGSGNGCIETDEKTGKAYWYNGFSKPRFEVKNMETIYRRWISEIQAAVPNVLLYIQGDCRGCSLYAMSPAVLQRMKKAGYQPESYYNWGIAIY